MELSYVTTFLYNSLHIYNNCRIFAIESTPEGICPCTAEDSTYRIAFIDALALVIRNFATFRFLLKYKVAVDAYGCDVTSHYAPLSWSVVFRHISVGFLLFI